MLTEYWPRRSQENADEEIVGWTSLLATVAETEREREKRERDGTVLQTVCAPVDLDAVIAEVTGEPEEDDAAEQAPKPVTASEVMEKLPRQPASLTYFLKKSNFLKLQ